MSGVTLAVIAKRPLPGAVKTRLTPPLSPVQAAGLAAAALSDTLAAIAAVPGVHRRVLVIDRPGVPLPAGFELLLQRGAGLDERLANAFADIGGPAVIVGMDTPQVSASVLSAAVSGLRDRDAVLGPARDGGYWAIGLRRPDPAALLGVPMSTARTGTFQRARLTSLGLTVAPLRPLRDVDTWTDALTVAAEAPGTRFAAAVAQARPQAAAA
jgi:rSAM/selenodomain-associated transferase 1